MCVKARQKPLKSREGLAKLQDKLSIATEFVSVAVALPLPLPLLAGPARDA